jgi:hypothetical protein
MKVSVIIKSVIIGLGLLLAAVPTFGKAVDAKPIASHIVEPTFCTDPAPGTYEVYLIIDETGKVIEATTPSTLDGFEKAVIKWKFSPAIIDGVPTKVKAVLPVVVK